MRRVKKSCFGLLIIPLLALSCRFSRETISPSELPEHWQRGEILVDGLWREYLLYVPDSPSAPAPLVLLLHGGTGSMGSVFRPYAGGSKAWVPLAAQEQFFLLVPNGTNAKTGDPGGTRQNWNDLRPDPAEGQTEVDDVAFLEALLDEVLEAYPVDPERIFVSGASNGGMMTYRLLIEIPERFAAGAAFIANLPELEEPIPNPGQPTPLMIANGTEDPLVQWAGGEIPRDRGLLRSTGDTVAWWVTANRASPEEMRETLLPDQDPEDGCRIIQRDYPPALEGAELVFYELQGGGHAIPSASHPLPENILTRRLIGPVCRDAEGVDLAWDFFIQSAGKAP